MGENEGGGNGSLCGTRRRGAYWTEGEIGEDDGLGMGFLGNRGVFALWLLSSLEISGGDYVTILLFDASLVFEAPLLFIDLHSV